MSVASISDLPSARAFNVRGQISVEKYISWANSPDALNDSVGDLSILEMRWGKTPGRVAHEYLILVLESTALRLERDAPWWLSVLSPDFRDQCKDTVMIGGTAEHLAKHTDQVLATLTIEPSVLRHSDFIVLLELITASSTFYNVYTFNCWWFVYSLWSNLARCIPNASLRFRVVTPDVVPGRAQGLDAVEFSQKLQEGHLSGLVRVRGDPAALRTKRDVEGVSALVESSFRHVEAAKIHLGVQMESRLQAARSEWTRELGSCRLAHRESVDKLQAAVSEMEGKNASLERKTMELSSKLRISEDDGRRVKEKLEEGKLRQREIEGKNATLGQQAESQAAQILALTNQLRDRAHDIGRAKEENDRLEKVVKENSAATQSQRAATMAHFSDGGGTANLPPSIGDMRLQLQTLLDRNGNQLQQAGTLGQRVLAQQMELEERVRQLQDMEADKTDDDDIDADMKKGYRELTDIIRTWDSENVQLSSAFGGQRLVNGTPTPPSPFLEPVDLGRVDTERVINTSTGTSAAQARRARNAAHRQDDVEFAFEIGSGLLTEVRRLQSLLCERDKAIQDMKEEKCDSEKTLESLRTALTIQEQSADKFKEEIWNLEVTLQELRTQLTDTQATSQRLEGEHKRLTKQLNFCREQVDQHKNESERLHGQCDELKAKRETDVADARKHAASLQRDKADLQSSIDSLKAEVAKAGIRLPHFGSPLTPNGDHNKSQMVTPDMRDDDDIFGSTTGGASTRGRKFDNGAPFPPDGFDPDSSPDSSPSKHLIAPNHPSNEIERLQRQLAHAQRQIATVKGALQREKETRMDNRWKLDASPGGMALGPEEEEEMDDVEEMGVLPKPKTKVTSFRTTRGRGRGRGRGGLTLAQRLGIAANSPASEYNDDQVTVTPTPPLPALSTSLQDLMFDEAEEDQDGEVRQASIGEQSPTPSNSVSVDGMDPAFANVLKRKLSTSSIPPQFSPLRQSVVTRGARAGTVVRRNRGGAVFAAESDVTHRQSVTAVEFGVQTEVVEEPLVVFTPPPTV